MFIVYGDTQGRAELLEVRSLVFGIGHNRDFCGRFDLQGLGVYPGKGADIR